MIEPKPKEPKAPCWVRVAPWGNGHCWQSGRMCVTSTVDDGEWHVSVSVKNKEGPNSKPNSVVAKVALRAFDMLDAEENHTNANIARHFFKPIPGGGQP